MLTPQSVIEMIMCYHAKDTSAPDYVADLILDGLEAAGYVVLNRDQYLDSLADHAATNIKQPVVIVRTEVVDYLSREAE